MHAPFSVALLGAVFSIRTAVVCKDFSADWASVRKNFCADTIPAILVPPGLLAVVGTEKPGSGSWGIDQFATAVLAGRLARSTVTHQADLSAISLYGALWDAQGIGYGCIGSVLLAHSHNLLFL